MELVSNTSVFFDPVSHSYIGPGDKLLTGLTSLMAKHGLSPDYSGIPEAVLRKAAKEGTEIHKYLQDYDEGNLVPSSELLDAYKQSNLHARHLASEYLVSDNEIVATSIDKVYSAGEGLVDIADVKTTSEVHKRALAWQLGAGKVLFERQNPGVKVRDTFCIWIDKKSRRLREIIPITPVAESEVDALIQAEREGRIYTDTVVTESAEVVLPESDLQTYVDKVALVADLKARLKETEAAIKDYEARLLQYMLDKGIEEMSTGEGVVKIKKGYQRETVDSAKLAKDYPQLAAKYKKITEVSPSIIYKKTLIS